jgi:hypothetical protein
MIIRLVIDFGELVKVAKKRGKGWASGLRCMGVAGVYGPCVYLGVFLLL